MLRILVLFCIFCNVHSSLLPPSAPLRHLTLEANRLAAIKLRLDDILAAANITTSREVLQRRVAIADRNNPYECSISRELVPFGRKVVEIEPNKWIQFSEYHQLHRRQPTSYPALKHTYRSPLAPIVNIAITKIRTIIITLITSIILVCCSFAWLYNSFRLQGHMVAKISKRC